jgi:hypothetical protein
MTTTDEGSISYFNGRTRSYITENFLSGLEAAGVPEDLLWAPKRLLWKGVEQTGTDTIEDKLWIPTEYEMFNGNHPLVVRFYDHGFGDTGVEYLLSGPWANTAWETPTNQAHLEYYWDGYKRAKYSLNPAAHTTIAEGEAVAYWTASQSKGGGYCLIYPNLYRQIGGAESNSSKSLSGTYSIGIGVAPAFCIK